MIVDGKVLNRVGRWGVGSITEHARKFSSRAEFARSAPGCFKASKRLGVIDDLFPLTLTIWDRQKVVEAASLCARLGLSLVRGSEVLTTTPS